MAVRNPTKWAAPSGTGVVTPSTGADIATQSGVTLATQASVNLAINPGIYTPKQAGVWTPTAKNKSQWVPESGTGSIVTVGNELFVDNLGNFMVTNAGDNLVTTTTYAKARNATQWTATGV